MDKWMKVALAVSVPTLSFLVLHDTVQGFYGPKRDLPLSYVVIEPEETAELESDDAVDAVAPEEAEAITMVEPDPVDVVEDESVEPVPEETVAEIIEDEGPAEPVTEATTELAGLLSDDEMKAGEAAARTCASCHQLARERNAVGPHLVGLAGRTIGSIDGFRYSEALQALYAENAVWDAEALDAWLENPDAFASGTKMMFKVNDPEERRLIAGWLMQRAD